MGEVWEFKPFKGAGPLKFGMTTDQVEALIGPPKSTETDDIMEEITEQRGPITLLYDDSKQKLFRIDFRAAAPLSVEGGPIFGEKDPIARLSKLDKDVKEGGGYTNFQGLGLMLGGFGKKRIPEGKLVITYSKAKLKEYTYFTEV